MENCETCGKRKYPIAQDPCNLEGCNCPSSDGDREEFISEESYRAGRVVRELQRLEIFKMREAKAAELFVDVAMLTKPAYAIAVLNTFDHLIQTLRGLISTAPATIHATLTGESEPMNPTPGQQAILTIGETNAEGAVVSLVPANLTFVSTDPTIATVSPNGDGNATVTFIAPGQASIITNDTVFGLAVETGFTVDAPPPPVDVTPTAITAVLGAPFTPGATEVASEVVKKAKAV